MKKLLFSILTVSVMSTIIISCDQETEVADPISPSIYPTITVSAASDNSLTVDEDSVAGGADTLYFNVELDKMSPSAITVSAQQVGGTASADDFVVIPGVVSPYTTTATMAVIVMNDTLSEEAETLELEIGAFDVAQFNINPASNYPENVNVTINNFVSPTLDMVFEWDFTVEVGEDEYHGCGDVDFDIFVADAEGFDINDPWATARNDVYAATGDCPEVLSFDGLPDGSYILFAELWTNAISGAGANTPMPITATFNRYGTPLQNLHVVQDESQVINSDTPGVDDDTYDGEVIDVYVAEVTISDGTYTVKSLDGTVVGSGRTKTNRTARPAITLRNK